MKGGRPEWGTEVAEKNSSIPWSLQFQSKKKKKTNKKNKTPNKKKKRHGENYPNT